MAGGPRSPRRPTVAAMVSAVGSSIRSVAPAWPLPLLGRPDGRWRLFGQIARVREARDRRGKPFAERPIALPCRSGFELAQQLEDPGAAFGGGVEGDMEVRDPLDPEARPELVTNPRHRPAQRGN